MKKLLLLFIVSLSVITCDNAGFEKAYSPGLTLKNDVVGYAAGSMFMTVDVNGPWSLSLDFLGEQPWAELGVVSGDGRRVDVDIYWTQNDTDETRALSICLIYESGVIKKELKQGGKSTTRPNWMELPDVRLSGDQQFLYHNQIIKNEEIRSWSYLWDPDHLVSLWVAYPLNKELIGSGSRTDQWGLDPNLPREKQPVLFDPYRGGYQRGHQLPSADRYNKAANIQTFYGTNMTPQNGGLNGGVWASLESRVREWSYKFDTLYVVTGCTVAGSKSKAYDNDNKAVTVPTGYFKALLGYTRGGGFGITPQTGGYTGIGFYMPHNGYPSQYMDSAMTLDELEEKTGFDFFVNLPEQISEKLAEYVEETKDKFWYN